MDLSKLGKEIIVEKTSTTRETIQLGEGEFACPHCESSSGKVTIGHRDGPGVTGPITTKCGLCQGTQIVIPCKDCGKLLAKTKHNLEYQKCFECTTELFKTQTT